MASGRFERRPETAEHDADAARLRAQGKTYDYIANAMGYAHRSGARRAAQRALAAITHEAGEELRVLEVERLDRLLDVAWQVMQRTHHAHSAGRLIRGDGNAPIVDDGPTLAAVDRILKIMERRARLLGLDAPARHQVPTIDVIDAEVARLEREHPELTNPPEESQP